MTKQTHFRTFQIKRNDNLSVPIGNLVWAQAFFERFGLDEVVRAFKTKGTDLAKLAEAMVAYKAGDNFSILRCHEFMMQPPIREALGLPEFDVRGLYRAGLGWLVRGGGRCGFAVRILVGRGGNAPLSRLRRQLPFQGRLLVGGFPGGSVVAGGLRDDASIVPYGGACRLTRRGGRFRSCRRLPHPANKYPPNDTCHCRCFR